MMNRTIRITLFLFLLVGMVGVVFATGDQEGGDQAADTDFFSLPYTGEEVTLTYFAEGNPEGEEKDRNKDMWKAYEEMWGNIKIEKTNVTEEERDIRLSIMYATGIEFDMSYCTQPLMVVPPIAASGILLNFTDYEEYMPNLKKAAAKYPGLNMMLDNEGNRYAVHKATSGDLPYLLTVANSTYFESMNQSLPVKTSDDWLDVIAEQQAADPDTVSVGDIWSGSGNILWVLGGMFNAGRGVQMWAYDDGWYWGPADPDHGMKETLQWMNKVYELGGFHEEWLTYTVDQYTEFMQGGNWAVIDTYPYAFSTTDGTGPRKNLDDYEVEYFTIPKGPTGANEAMGGAFFDGAPWDGLIASSDTEYPELVAGVVDTFYSEKGIEFANWGIEGVTFVKGANGRNKFVDDFIGTAAVPDPPKKFADYFLGGTFMNRAAAVELAAPSIAKRYNEFSVHIIEKWASELAAGNMTGARVSWTGDTLPAVSAEESEKIGEIMAPMDTHFKEMRVAFITGERDFSEWDDYQAELRSMGDLQWVIDVYNTYPAPVVLPRDWEHYFD